MRSTDNGATWAPAETLGIVSSYSQLATDRDGYVYFIGHANPPYIQTVQRSTDDGCTWGPVDTLFHHVLNIFTDRDHVFCFGYRSTLDTLLLTISTDRGASWEAGAAITPFGNLPYTAIDESGALHVAWNDNRSGNYEIYYTRSLDHGASWCPQQRLTISSDASMMWLGTQGSAVYISYVVSGVCYKRVSLDGGVSWEAESRWPWNSGPTSNLCVGALADAGRIHLLHLQWGLGPAYWIQYRRSTDFGATWPDSAAVSDSNSLDRYPDAVVCEGNDVHVLWEDYASGNFEVYYRRGTGLAGSNETANPPVGHRPSIHLQAKANPCTPPVILKALLPEQGAADLRVYDVLGREVRCIQVVRTCDSPIVTLTWDGNDGAGRPAPSGIYLLWLCAEGNDAGVRCAVLRR